MLQEENYSTTFSPIATFANAMPPNFSLSLFQGSGTSTRRRSFTATSNSKIYFLIGTVMLLSPTLALPTALSIEQMT